ncbi:MAG: hypothetical protein IIY62_06390, partial [Kiritimatiellae bacterium]|nr:hypothetical protein [Kiritimatiellia bacterium]
MKKTFWTILATVAAISASAATVKDLSDKEVLTIDANTTWYGTTGRSPINVPGNTRAVINIKKGKTLTVYGADASGQTFGVPAIYVPPTATLYITGEGTLIAQGGAAANGENGSSGENGYLNTSSEHGWGGDGGNGGAGGGGGAAAIGGNGGGGGNGGDGRGCDLKDCVDTKFGTSGYDGYSGGNGESGCGMGKVVILGNVTVRATAGAAASSSGSGGSNGVQATDDGSGWQDAYVS